MDDEALAARQINAEPWEPMPGMVKLRCTDCRYWFAARDAATERCPDCETKQPRAEGEAVDQQEEAA